MVSVIKKMVLSKLVWLLIVFISNALVCIESCLAFYIIVLSACLSEVIQHSGKLSS